MSEIAHSDSMDTAPTSERTPTSCGNASERSQIKAVARYPRKQTFYRKGSITKLGGTTEFRRWIQERCGEPCGSSCLNDRTDVHGGSNHLIAATNELVVRPPLRKAATRVSRVKLTEALL